LDQKGNSEEAILIFEKKENRGFENECGGWSGSGFDAIVK